MCFWPPCLVFKLENLVTTCLKHPCPFPYRETQHDSKIEKSGFTDTQVETNLSILWRVLLQHCECRRCLSMACGMKVAWVPTCMYPASHCLHKISKFQKLGSVRVFLASLPSKLPNLVSTCLKHPCPLPYRGAE